MRCSNDERLSTTTVVGIGLLALARRQGWGHIPYYGKNHRMGYYHLETFVLPVLVLVGCASEEESR